MTVQFFDSHPPLFKWVYAFLCLSRPHSLSLFWTFSATIILRVVCFVLFCFSLVLSLYSVTVTEFVNGPLVKKNKESMFLLSTGQKPWHQWTWESIWQIVFFTFTRRVIPSAHTTIVIDLFTARHTVAHFKQKKKTKKVGTKEVSLAVFSSFSSKQGASFKIQKFLVSIKYL